MILERITKCFGNFRIEIKIDIPDNLSTDQKNKIFFLRNTQTVNIYNGRCRIDWDPNGESLYSLVEPYRRCEADLEVESILQKKLDIINAKHIINTFDGDLDSIEIEIDQIVKDDLL